MYRRSTMPALAATLLLASLPHGYAAPLKVGSGNEAVIEPPVPHPDETPCTVPLVKGAKFGADAVSYSYTPPAACPGPWARVVLDISISLNQGRQFDRSGLLFLAGVPLWFGTTAEPRATLAPRWSFQKDVTDYTALFGTAQAGTMQIPNYQSPVYTSTITADATLLFYPATASAPAPLTADVVLPFPTGGGVPGLGSSSDTAAISGTLPTNILHATLDLYLQGQSADEFWYTCVPNALASTLESCGNTAFREGEITVDGTPAGVAPIYPWIFTGGIDPYLWQPIPGVQTFDFKPFHADLSPFAGVLSNGASHTIATSVFNADNYFAATGALRLFLDHGASTVTGAVTQNSLQAAPSPVLTQSITTTDGVTTGTLDVKLNRSFTIKGSVTGSAGTTVNTLTQHDSFANHQVLDVSGSKDLQNVTQTTDVTVVTSSNAPGATSTTTDTLHYPLSVAYDFKTAKGGNSTQITKINQQYLADSVTELNGSPVAQDSLTDAILTSDILFFNGNNSVTGHKSQMETANYARTGTSAPCFKRTLVSTYNILTTVKTGC